MKTPISVITGYLGAGKTSFLKNILEQTSRKIAVIMNEFGDIGIDTKIIKGKNIEIKELLGGCVCCSLTGEFKDAVKEVVEKFSPELIIIETTGVAEPDSLISDMKEMKNIAIHSIITIVDSDAIVKYPHIGHTGRIQIEIADILIVNKKDLVTKEQLKQVKELLRSINQKAVIFTSTNGKMNLDLIFNLDIEHTIKKLSHKKHKTLIEFFSFSTALTLNKNKFENFANNIDKNIYRVKGIINLSDKNETKSYLFQYVAGRWSLEPWEKSEKTELIFIGKKAKQLENEIIANIEKSKS